MKKTTLEDCAVCVVVRLDGLLGIFELNERKAFAFAVDLFEWDVYLEPSVVAQCRGDCS